MFALGLLIGFFVAFCLFRKKPKHIGTLLVDESDPTDGPYLFLELSAHPEMIKRMTNVTMEVKVKKFVSSN
jgi:hypothetical protein